ncbi:MAG: ABC transporter ATP-binding protein [bacterium]
MSLIEMVEVQKQYFLGETVVHALNGVSLNIDKGEFVGVWGPSGSGKTTLLNLIGAIDNPSSGEVHVNGHDVFRLTDDQRTELRNNAIGFIFQNFNLIPVLSALENVMLPLQLKGMPSMKARQKASELLEEVGLPDVLHQRPDKMSGGQRQRVAVARALVTAPSLVIADEPTANLDTDTSYRIIALMRHFNEEKNTTFIFSTHDQRLLGEVRRLVKLVDGRIKEDGKG